MPRINWRKLWLVLCEYRFLIFLIGVLILEVAFAIMIMSAAGWPTPDAMVPLG